ncbi:MAG: histidine triad nucleotide-binding protein [Oscillospiraceae bacterium]|nr:histidine triad nucleotide-binding protein [Lachnospiraceae bacterium]MBQ5521469.1 histidine triad nucleotide-binding protein [Oscillospiraceae bacterium]
MNDCLFCKIIAGEIPSKKVYEDDLCFAFYDISPLAPTHFLVVPKSHIASAAELTEDTAGVVGHIYALIARLAGEMGFSDGYRVVTNCGAIAGQTVHHLHFHVLAGKELGSFN